MINAVVFTDAGEATSSKVGFSYSGRWAHVSPICGRSTNIGSVPVLLYGADRASSKQASGLTFQSGRSRLGRRYSVTVARPDHKNRAVGAKRLIQSNLQRILRLPPRAV